MKQLIPILRSDSTAASKLNIEKSAEKSWEDTYQHLMVMCKDTSQYIPNTYLQYYLYPEQMVKKSDPTHTRANEVIEHREKIEFELAHRIIKQGSLVGITIKDDLHGRYIIQVVNAIANNMGKTHIIIVPNKGTIPFLPDDAMVEVDCHVDAKGPRSLHIKDIPLFQQALLQNQYAVESLLVDAWYQGSKQKLIEALTLSRTVVDLPKAKILANQILEANKKWLPQFFK